MSSSKKLTIILFLATFASLTNAASANFVKTDWMFVAPITVATNPTNSYLQANLSREHESKLQPNFADLRIIKDGVEEVPYYIVQPSTVPSVPIPPIKAKILNVFSNGTTVDFILDLGPSGTGHDRVQIETDTENFKRPVSVYTSDELLVLADPRWNLVSQNGSIYNYTDPKTGFKASDLSIKYPESTSQYVRVVVRPGEGPTINVQTVNVEKEVETQNVLEEETFATDVIIFDKKEEKRTEIIADLKAEGIHSHRIALRLQGSATKDFIRKVSVETSADTITWEKVKESYLYSVDTKLYKGSEVGVDYPESTHRYVRIKIFNEGEVPLDFAQEVDVTRYARYVVFPYSGEGKYEMYLSNPRAKAPVYDAQKIWAGSGDFRVLPNASVGMFVENSAYVALLPVVTSVDNRQPYLVGTAIILLVLGVGTLIYLFVQKYKKR